VSDSPKPRPRVLLTALILGALVWAGGAFLLAYFEPVVETHWVGFQGEAAKNRLLAVERFLTAMGYPTRTAPGDAALPASDHVLILIQRSAALTKLSTPALLDWVARGGRLVVTPLPNELHPDDDGRQKDPLLAAIGVEAAARELSDSMSELVHLDLSPIQARAAILMPRGPRLFDLRHAATVSLPHGSAAPPSYVLHPPFRPGALLLTVPHGRGSVTVVSDLELLDNNVIDKNDHAAFALWLVQGKAHPAGVELREHTATPTLGELAVRFAWMVLIPALLLGGALAWRAAARFGPLLPEPPSERRSLLEHLDAAARWLWHNDQGVERRLLVDAVRRSLRQRVAVRQPGWSKLPGPQLIQHLADNAGLAAPEVADALHGAAISDEASFLAAVQTLTQIRRSL
jgi:uncharacterized protein DUF4350